MNAYHRLKDKSDLHMARKLWHILGVLGIVVIFRNVPRTTALQLITFCSFLSILIDVLRNQIPSFNRVVLSVFGPIMREHERNSISGTTYLLLGVFTIVLLFPKSIVSLSLLFLAVADPLASYIGILYGKDKIWRNKSLQGSVAAFMACFILSVIYYYLMNLMTERIVIVSLLSGVVGAFSELFPVGRLDDNFTFPVISSILLWFLFYLFGGFL